MVPSWCQQLCTSCPGVCKHQYWASDSLPPLVLEDTDLHHSNLIGSPPEQWGRAREHWNANSKETSLDLGSVALKQRWVQVFCHSSRYLLCQKSLAHVCGQSEYTAEQLGTHLKAVLWAKTLVWLTGSYLWWNMNEPELKILAWTKGRGRRCLI